MRKYLSKKIFFLLGEEIINIEIIYVRTILLIIVVFSRSCHLLSVPQLYDDPRKPQPWENNLVNYGVASRFC